MDIVKTLSNLWNTSGFANFTWQNAVMLVIACVFLYLGIKKQFEPLLLVGIAFGMLLTNLPMIKDSSDVLYHPEMWTGEAAVAGGVDYLDVLQHGGLIDILYIGVKTGIYPCLIFIGVGAMTDFGPLISNPKSLLLGAAAQLGIYVAFFLAICLGFEGPQAASIGIIGGADGPTAIWLTKSLAPEILAPIAVAAYSYMALIPIIQPPLMKALTTSKERNILMKPTREVSKAEKILFPIIVTLATCLILPSVAGLLGCLMFGNLLKECGVTGRLADTAQNALMNIVTLFLGISVGATAKGENFLQVQTLYIIALGLFAFMFATVGGLLLGKLMCKSQKAKSTPSLVRQACPPCPWQPVLSTIRHESTIPTTICLCTQWVPTWQASSARQLQQDF